MNPFNLYGLQFLQWYACFAAIVVILAVLVRRRWEAYAFTARMEHDLLDDPYTIAYFTGGKAHMVRVTAFSLLDRGLLKADGHWLATTEGLYSLDAVRRPLEKAILQRCMTSCRLNDLLGDNNITLVSERAASTLQSWGLIPDLTDWQRRASLLVVGMLLCWSVSVGKIMIAFSRERSNAGLLMILTLVATFVLIMAIWHIRTATGDQVLQRLRALCAALRSRAQAQSAGSETNELALLAAVYDFQALPAARLSLLQPLNLGVAPSDIGDAGGSSSGASTGGGSSCGGGSSGCGGCGS